jgi:hypothetical protein
MNKNKKSLYEITYSDDEYISLEKDELETDNDIPENIEQYQAYDDALNYAEKLAQKKYDGNIDMYAQDMHPEVITMYDDNMSAGEKLIQYIVDSGLK